jgi:hypothetical protein
MSKDWSRRNWLKLAACAVPFARIGFESPPAAAESAEKAGLPNPELVPDTFPTQPAELVREMVTVSHFDLKRVQELLKARPSLARASWDWGWGFGDWESALGAASHMGNKPIAEYLISRGGRPSLFSAAMLGQLEVVKAMIIANPGAQRIRGPHGIGLLDREIAILAGTYLFGYGESQRIEVTVEEHQGLASIYSPLTWTRRGMMGRPLVYVGERSFYPARAPSVRINFAEKDASVVMTVHDLEPVLVGKKNKVLN